jgi:hypothetical protein
VGDHTFTVGQHVIWVSRSHSEYPVPLAAEIFEVRPTCVRIRVARRNGDLVERWVRPQHLHLPSVGVHEIVLTGGGHP